MCILYQSQPVLGVIVPLPYVLDENTYSSDESKAGKIAATKKRRRCPRSCHDAHRYIPSETRGGLSIAKVGYYNIFLLVLISVRNREP